MDLDVAKKIVENNEATFLARTIGFESDKRGELRAAAFSIVQNQNRVEKIKEIIKQEDEFKTKKNEKELNDKIRLEENLAKASKKDDKRSQKEIDQEKKKNEKIAADKEKIEACRICIEANADYVKTSTGFGPSGAAIEDIRLIKKTVGDSIKIKAAGGIKTRTFADDLIKAGADRLGTSSSIAIIKG